MTYKIFKTDEDWKEQLSPEQFRICRKKDTERPFTGIYNDCKEKGTYNCLCCGVQLFSSDSKFDSGSGWPSMVWKELKLTVNNVVHIWVMFLMMDHNQQI